MIKHNEYWIPTIIVKWEVEDIQAVMQELNIYPITRFAAFSFMSRIDKHNPEITWGTIYETINEIKRNEYIELNREWINDELVREILININRELYMQIKDDIDYVDTFLKKNGQVDINKEARRYIQLVTTGQFVEWEDFVQFMTPKTPIKEKEHKQSIYELSFNRFIDEGKNLDEELLKWLTEKSK